MKLLHPQLWNSDPGDKKSKRLNIRVMDKLIDDLALRELLDIKNNYQEWTKKPSLIDGRYLITDAHVVVSIPQDRVNCVDYYTGPDSEKFIPVMEEMIPCSPVSVNFQSLRQFMTDEYVRETIEHETIACSACSGEGYTTCNECNHDHECDSCKGMGDVLGKKLPKPIKIYDYGAYFLINGVPFLMNMISQLSNIAEFIGLVEHDWTVTKKHEKKLVFTCNNIEMLVMGCLIDKGFKCVSDINQSHQPQS